ncbi:MAG: MtrB/PioB family outer membrane beta-barrel protein, partial [Betaproteobacteria bacterium]
MRSNKLTIATAALLLASATLVRAQDKPQPETTTASGGSIDIGGRFTSTTGDEARYERYRDLRDGANVNLHYSRETPNWTFDVKAQNIGYRDGRYVLKFNSRRVQLWAQFDQTPLNYSYDTRTPYSCTAGNCALDPGLRAAVQAKTAVGIPANVGQLAGGSVYDSIARPFDLQSRRDTIAAQAKISATDNLDFIFGVNSYKRSGNQPFGASFAFSVATELPIVIDNRETELSAAVEWASHQGMFHLGYEHSKFSQNVPFFTFDNPQFATDFCRTGLAGQAPGACYDPSGYSNGNGPAFGRMAQPPTSTLDTWNWAGMVKLPGRTTANASFAVGANRQDE